MTTTPPSLVQRDALEALAVRCKQASGPDRAIDLDVELLNNSELATEVEGLIAIGRKDAVLRWGTFPALTGSLDAAMTLVPEGADVAFCILSGRAFAGFGSERNGSEVEAATLPLAICAAALRSLALKSGETE